MCSAPSPKYPTRTRRSSARIRTRDLILASMTALAVGDIKTAIAAYGLATRGYLWLHH